MHLFMLFCPEARLQYIYCSRKTLTVYVRVSGCLFWYKTHMWLLYLTQIQQKNCFWRRPYCRSRTGTTFLHFISCLSFFEIEDMVPYLALVCFFSQGEFLCPVCRRLANSILPTLPKESQKVGKRQINSALSQSHADGYLDTLDMEINFPHVRKALSLLQSAANTVGKREVLQALPMHKTKRIKRDLEPVLRVLFGMYFPGKMDMFAQSANGSHSSVMWDTLRYSLISTEIAACGGRTCMTPTYSLDSLYKELGESGGFILSLLLKIVQSSRRKDPTQVLQRFSGLQLFTASICSGISIDSFIWSTSERGGTVAIAVIPLCFLYYHG